MQFPFDDSWGVSNRLPGWIYVASAIATRFDHKGGSGKMVCCWQGLVKRRRSADKRLVWIRLIVVDTIACETILFHDYWMVFWMVQTKMFFSGVMWRMPLRVCSFWLMWYDGVITFLKGVICSGAEILACRVCINVCWLYVSCLFPLVAENESNLSQRGATFHAFPAATMGFDHSTKEACSRSFVAHKGAEGETIRTWASGLLGCWGETLVFNESQTQTAWLLDAIWRTLRFRFENAKDSVVKVWFGTTPQWGISTVSRYAAQRHARLWPFALPASDLGSHSLRQHNLQSYLKTFYPFRALMHFIKN